MSEPRATATEFLDHPACDPALAAASYRFMEFVNRCFGGTRLVQDFLAREVATRPAGAPFRLLDIGSGSCDIPLALSRWARAASVPLQVTCLEVAPRAVDLARARLAHAADPAVHLLQEDAFSHRPAEPYDGAVASMCFHHFSDAQILALLQRLRRFVLGSVLINDLRRCRRASVAARLLLVGRPAGVRHDALLSIQRGFTVPELSALLQQLDRVSVSVRPAPWFRLAAIVRFGQGESS